MNDVTYHEVDGMVIEVRPNVDDILMASTIEHGRAVVLSQDSDAYEDYSVCEGIAEHLQLIAIKPPRPETLSALKEAIRQRRSGEVVPEDLPPDWLDI